MKTKFLLLLTISLATVLLFIQSVVMYKIDEVQRAIVITRHGARTSFHTLPGEEEPVCLQPIISYGKHQENIIQPSKKCLPGDLVQAGFDQHKKLGQKWRKQYSHLIGSKFNANKVYLRSSDTPRTRASLAGQLEGMYHNSQNITVFTQNPDLDGFFPYFPTCKWHRQYKSYVETFINFDENALKTLQIRTNTTLPWDGYYDQFQSAIAMNHTCLGTLAEINQSKLEVSKIWSALYCNKNDTLHLKSIKLAIGPIFNDLQQFLTTDYKFGIFSCHDTVIAPLMSVLTDRNWACELPDFASDIVFEILKDNKIRVLFRGEKVKLVACQGFECGIGEVFKGFERFKMDAVDRKEKCAQEFGE